MWAQTLVSPRSFSLGDVPDADLDPGSQGQVLIEVLAGGICGSDLPLFKGLAPLRLEALAGVPGYPLHEVVGRVLKSDDDRLAPGTHVVGWAMGLNGLAEKLVVLADDVQEYDRRLSPTTAVLLQPLACVLSALTQLRGWVPDSAAVIGQGPIGVLFSHALKSLGVRHVIGVDPVDRSDVADAFAIDCVVDDIARNWVIDLADEERPELVVEAVGHQTATVEDAIDAVCVGGRILNFGIPDEEVYPFPMQRFLRKDATMWAGFTRDKQAALRTANTYLADHPDLSENYVTNIFRASSAQEAFEVAAVPSVGRLKVVLDMS
jgi:L-iditol 2-dehydrogenase